MMKIVTVEIYISETNNLLDLGSLFLIYFINYQKYFAFAKKYN